MKRCTKCKDRWPRECFYGDRNQPDGLRRICKACYAETPCIVRRNAERAAIKAANARQREARAA